MSFLSDAWEGGISDAGYTLATMYYNGICTSQDIDKSRKLATQAAKDGYILAQRMIGLSYIGEKWEKLYSYDIEKGIFWLSKAGDAGDSTSSGELSYIYLEGVGVPPNDKKYFYWLKQSVFSKYEKGNIAGFMALAKCYEEGKGTKKNLVKAYKYYDLNGTAGVEDKQRIAKDMTQDQIDEATQESQEWQKEHNVDIGGSFIRRAN